MLKEEIISQHDERLSHIPPETKLAQKQCYDLEADIIRSVCGKEKTVKSSWMAGFGPVLKKKDRVALALALQFGPSEADILQE